MNTDTKSKISKMIYHLGTENRAAANKELRQIIEDKVKIQFDKQYQKVKDTFSKEK